ncbi:hypothetical protein F0562_021126 [Nyssa sinensis]|uniref:Uncharacterized protein n=1 Tax=Nyssa sinensis TaxID=561372 RepID=A0A5J5BKM2_9ASTE|nr:hypothetical protein F0562_021126 [Nyssa sinensis]
MHGFCVCFCAYIYVCVCVCVFVLILLFLLSVGWCDELVTSTFRHTHSLQDCVQSGSCLYKNNAITYNYAKSQFFWQGWFNMTAASILFKEKAYQISRSWSHD